MKRRKMPRLDPTTVEPEQTVHLVIPNTPPTPLVSPEVRAAETLRKTLADIDSLPDWVENKGQLRLYSQHAYDTGLLIKSTIGIFIEDGKAIFSMRTEPIEVLANPNERPEPGDNGLFKLVAVHPADFKKLIDPINILMRYATEAKNPELRAVVSRLADFAAACPTEEANRLADAFSLGWHCMREDMRAFQRCARRGRQFPGHQTPAGKRKNEESGQARAATLAKAVREVAKGLHFGLSECREDYYRRIRQEVLTQYGFRVGWKVVRTILLAAK